VTKNFIYTAAQTTIRKNLDYQTQNLVYQAQQQSMTILLKRRLTNKD